MGAETQMTVLGRYLPMVWGALLQSWIWDLPTGILKAQAKPALGFYCPWVEPSLGFYCLRLYLAKSSPGLGFYCPGDWPSQAQVLDSTVLGFSQAKPRSWILPSWGLFRPAKPRSWSPHPALDRCSTGAQIKAGSSDWTHICLGAQIQDGSSDRIHILPKASSTSAKQSKHFSTKPHYSLTKRALCHRHTMQMDHRGIKVHTHIMYHVLWDHVLCIMSYILCTMYCVLDVMCHVLCIV